ncbi:conserved hypothetical protein [Methylocella silvestris BL2]|uniref:Uncharacterized protein n=1 Tax=Methylocella silvestris (strain DSM 15510 / CIP 108128 / LMG 27833 / NCIMB 13906 / BL2) TaxID=395965 RepID=B8ERD7_METSB|nr:hypothetical protein [Methylocella silvestris]ACK50321.1 conserved hypothetical protein [Methylocella silvestris BL2]
MITGQQALWRLEQATAAVRAEETQSANALAAADRELAGLRAGRTALLRQLAGARLDAMQSEKIAGDLASAEQRALKMLDDGRAALEQLMAKIAAAQAARMAAEGARRAKSDEVAEILNALEDLQAGVEAKVRASGDWIASKEAVDRAQKIFAAAESKATAATDDSAAKAKPYEDDPLFMYLWSRGFGTSAYRAGLFVRFIDEKVAQLVGFQNARPNYAMLKEIPARLRQHAERCRAAVDEERRKQAAIEAAGLDAAGAKPLNERLDAARLALSEADSRLKAADATLQKLDAEHDRTLKSAAQTTGAEAVAIVSDADSRASIAELYRKAAMTMSPADDSLVRQIEAGDKTLAAAERRRVDLLGKAQAIAQRRHEIETERARFYRRGYDNPMGGFSNESAISDALGGFLKGAITGAVLGQVFQGGFQERDRRADSGFGGDGGFNFPGGAGGGWIDPGSGGFGGDGGGGFGGDDGFRTGGGF